MVLEIFKNFSAFSRTQICNTLSTRVVVGFYVNNVAHLKDIVRILPCKPSGGYLLHLNNRGRLPSQNNACDIFGTHVVLGETFFEHRCFCCYRTFLVWVLNLASRFFSVSLKVLSQDNLLRKSLQVPRSATND